MEGPGAVAVGVVAALAVDAPVETSSFSSSSLISLSEDSPGAGLWTEVQMDKKNALLTLICI